MPNIKILDCTLRDGGYNNSWRFGQNCIKSVISGLVEAKMDFIECGYLSNKYEYQKDSTIYRYISDVNSFLVDIIQNSNYIVMINYGEYRVEDIPLCKTGKIKGLRVAFHKKDMVEAIAFCKSLKEKGYLVFVQPMVSLSYTDEEFVKLIQAVNKIDPYAFYIVDSFGIMKRNDLTRLFYIVDHNLNQGINIGYHSHNNLQLAYSNAQMMADFNTNRSIIIDASVYGMGRGAGNLNTELFVEHLNDIHGTDYSIKPLLSIIDNYLSDFFQQNSWGYSLPNYLSAKHNAHPNYATYLDEKKTLTYEAIDEIFALMKNNKKNSFDKNYIELLYTKYLERGNAQESNLSNLLIRLRSKTILLIAPGKSSFDERDKISEFINREHPIVISVNFDYSECSADFIFLSNLRRFSNLEINRKRCSIVTSNIPAVDAYAKIKYSSLLNNQDAVQDNAGLMLIKFLIQSQVKKIYLAGMDGYSVDSSQNYMDKMLTIYTNKAHAEAMNYGMNQVLSEFSRQIDIKFLTTPRFITLL